MKNYLRLIPATILMGALLACQFLGSGSQTPPPSSTILFQDDFSDPSSGWDRVTEDNGQTEYVNGSYRVYVNTTETDIWSNPGLDFTDVNIEVDATVAGGSQNNDFGITCRVVDQSHFYFFVISSDGYYGIGKVNGDSQTLIGSESMQSTDLFKSGEPTYHLRVDCVGSSLTIYVNGKQISSVQDDQFTSGDVGLIAGSFDTPGTDILFDNFTVAQP